MDSNAQGVDFGAMLRGRGARLLAPNPAFNQVREEPNKVSFAVKDLIEMLMDALSDSGTVPKNLREWTEDREWSLRLVPQFKAPERGWDARPMKFGEVQITAAPQQNFLIVRVPFTKEPQNLFALYRAAIRCFRPECDSPGLRYVLEAGRFWYATACLRCNTVTWKDEKYMPYFVKQHLVLLRDLRQLITAPDEINPLKAWHQLHGDGRTPEDGPKMLLPGQPGFR